MKIKNIPVVDSKVVEGEAALPVDSSTRLAHQPNGFVVDPQDKEVLARTLDGKSSWVKVDRDWASWTIQKHTGFKTFMSNYDLSARLELKTHIPSMRDLLERRREIDYRAILDGESMAFFGERHYVPETRDEVIALIPILAELGFTHLALEFFNSDHQSFLDAYFESSITREELRRRTSDESGGNLPYFSVVEAAKKAGMRAIGIHNGHDYTSVSRDIWDKFDTENLSSKLDSLDFVFEHERDYFYPVFQQNIHAALHLASYLADGARVAVYGGAMHYGYYSDLRDAMPLNNVMRKWTGISGPVIHFVNFFDPRIPKIHNNVAITARLMGIQDERFMVRTEQSEEYFRPDFIVHLPGHHHVSRVHTGCSLQARRRQLAAGRSVHFSSKTFRAVGK